MGTSHSGEIKVKREERRTAGMVGYGVWQLW